MLGFDAEGHPISLRHGDVYRSRHGALAESAEVFVAGCRLPQAWGQHPPQAPFCVLEVGFGLGVNLLATLRAWRAARVRPRTLHFVTVESALLRRDEVSAAHAALALADDEDARRLRECWPAPWPGLHRCRLADDVVLTVACGEAARVLPTLRLGADAIFLDGFSPARNPDAWTPAVIRGLARRARPRARLATWSAAAAVRQTLAEAGFDVERRSGFGRKRHRLEAVYAPRWPTWAAPPAAAAAPDDAVLVVGSGLAGAALAATLAGRGRTVHWLGPQAAPAPCGSAQPRVATHLHASPDDNRLARLSRAAWQALGRMAAGTASTPLPEAAALGSVAGRLALAESAAQADEQRALVARLPWAQGWIEALDAAGAGAVAGVSLAHGGLWWPGAGALDPRALCAHWRRLALAHGARPVLAHAARLARIDGQWQALGSDGRPLAQAPHAVLATGHLPASLVALGHLPWRHTRGQTSWVDDARLAGLRTTLGGAAYAVPTRDGRALVGATYDGLDTGWQALSPDPRSDAGNAARLALAMGWREAPLARPAAVGVRHALVDRLPAIGPVPEEAAALAARASLLHDERRSLPAVPGLWVAAGFGSRGLLWAPLAAETIADALDGAPSAIEAPLFEASDPSRFLRPWLRRLR